MLKPASIIGFPSGIGPGLVYGILIKRGLVTHFKSAPHSAVKEEDMAAKTKTNTIIVIAGKTMIVPRKASANQAIFLEKQKRKQRELFSFYIG